MHSADEVLEDVNLIWANCLAYNEAESPVLADCKTAEAGFQERWLLAGLPAEKLMDRPPQSEVLQTQKEIDKDTKPGKKVYKQLPATILHCLAHTLPPIEINFVCHENVCKGHQREKIQSSLRKDGGAEGDSKTVTITIQKESSLLVM